MIHYLPLPEPETPMITITASSYQTDPPQPPTNVSDGDLNTKWAANGIGEWIKFTYDSTVVFSGIEIAHSYERENYFDVLVDSVVVLKDQIGTGNVLTQFNFDPVKGNELTIVANGNNSNSDWNSISEIVLLLDSIELPKPCIPDTIRIIDTVYITRVDTLVLWDTLYYQPKYYFLPDTVELQLE